VKIEQQGMHMVARKGVLKETQVWKYMKHGIS
jgi:hypothetical protein